MSGKATLVISSDTKDGEKAIANLVKEMAKIREENKKLKEENKKAAEEAKKQLQEQRESQKKAAEENRQQLRQQADARKKAAEESKQQFREQSEAHKRHIQQIKEEQKAEKEKAKEEKRLAEEQRRLAKDKLDQHTRFATTVMSTVGAYVSLSSILSAVNGKLQKEAELRREIAQYTTGSGTSQLDVVLNLQGASDKDKQRAVESAKEINRRTGFGNQDAVNRALAGALTASGGKLDVSVQAVESAARLSAGQPKYLEAYTGAGLGVAMRTGVSTDEALGAVLQAGTYGGVKDPALAGQLYRSVSATGAAMDSSGNPAEAARQSMVIAAALSSIVGDEAGSSTATATAQFESRMMQFFQGQKHDPGTTMARLAALQSNPRLSEEFDKKYNFEEKFNAPITRIAKDPEYAGAKIVREYNEGIRYSQEGYRSQVQSVASATPELRALNRQNRMQAALESSMEINTVPGLVEQTLDASEKARKITAGAVPSAYWQHLSGSVDRMGADMFLSPEERIRREIDETKQELARVVTGMSRPAFPTGQDPTQPDSRSYYDQFRQEGRAAFSRTRFGYEVPEERQALAEDIAKLIQVQEENLKELQKLNSAAAKPTVKPQGMQEAN